jgi:glycine/D-amino acid oxidase-like deaminating enzyme
MRRPTGSRPAGPAPADDGPVAHDTDADVVVIGSGSTGLSTALSLAETHGVQATVLEAKPVVVGLFEPQRRPGPERERPAEALAVDRALGPGRRAPSRCRDRGGFERFKGLTQTIDCDAHDGGHLSIAHRAEKMDALRAEARVMNEQFGYATRILGRDELQRDWCDEREAAGALYEAEGVGIHPLKFTYGLAARARALGVRLHTASPVQAGACATACTICARRAARCAHAASRSAPAATPASA